MKADLTRDTFDAKNHFRQVLAQQGRVQLDAELNEQSALSARRDETTTADIAGHCGGPAGTAAFGMSAGPPGDFLLSAGRYYVDGIQCELEEQVSYRNQPDLPGLPVLPAGGHLVYLDVWQRHLTFLDDQRLLETALAGVDTTTRVKTVWQVRTVTASVPLECSGNYAEYTARTQASTIRLQARTQPVAGADDPCQMAEGSGYTSLENQLYRVEVHSLQTAAEQARGVGRAEVCKWSRENASVEVELKAVNVAGKLLTVSSLGRDEKLGIRGGHFVEITDDSRELAGLHGDLIKVADVNEGNLTILLEDAPSIMIAVDPALHPRVRRWEGKANIQTNLWLKLEAGIQVKFADVNLARPGDYWQIPARTSAPGAQAGTIEWPQTVPGTADALFPRGIRHHYCRLGFVTVSAGAPVFIDCRCLWPALTSVPHLFFLGGDGQEVMPVALPPSPVLIPPPGSPLYPLPGLLIAGIANPHCAPGQRNVRFTISRGCGGVRAENLGLPAAAVTVPVDHDGYAKCEFHLDALNDSQQVRAELLDASGSAVRPAIFYNASLSVARKVAYDPECKGMAGADTVQKAISLLAGAIHLSAVGGDGQDGALNKELPLPLRVAVTSACGPVENPRVIFRSSRTDQDSPLGKLTSGEFALKAGGPYFDELPVTITKGIAECFWKLPAHQGFDVFEAIAELENPKDLKLEGPGEVRFTANLRTSGADEDPGAVHIIGVHFQGNLDPTGVAAPIATGADVAVQELRRPVLVILDAPLEPATIATPKNPGRDDFGIPSNPVCFLTVELPWPLLPGEMRDVEALKVAPIVMGFRPLILRTNAEFESESNNDGVPMPHRITIQIPDPTLEFLTNFLDEMQRRELHERLLLRLTLKGNFIWRETERRQLATTGPAGWLDGDSWRVTPRQHPSAMQSLFDQRLASGDRRRGGDFEMWFWLVQDRGNTPEPNRPRPQSSAGRSKKPAARSAPAGTKGRGKPKQK